MTAGGGFSCERCGATLAPGTSLCPACGTSLAVVPGDARTVAAPPRRPQAAEGAQLEALREATLGEYEILAELGRGGMATVFLAHDLPLDRKVAIKALAPALLAMGEGTVERFKREARTAAALTHPHIIPIYAVKQSERVLYFVMKYVEGRPLDSIIRDVGSLPIPMVQAILAHVGDALGYAHRHGVVHRDIKSANIMLDEEGWAVVTDFGIAKVVQAEGLTVTGVTVGTPTYMSPEQCQTREVTGASDQYSLGVVAYEMLTGRLPFRGDSIMSVMYAHFNERPRPVEELRPDCPPGLAAAVMRMLEKDPARRWPRMDDVVAACGRPSLRHDDPVRSEMITLAKAGGKSRVLDHVKTPTSPIPPARPPTRPLAAPAPRPRRISKVWWGVGLAGLAVVVWRVATWRESPLAPASRRADLDTGAAPLRATPAAADTVALRPPAESAAATAPVRGSPAPRGTAPPAAAGARPPAAESASRAAAAQREDSLLGSQRAAALAAMRQALEAGATPAEMARGDAVFEGGESLAARGRVSRAIAQLAAAASLWAEAERQSRSRAARDTPHQLPEAPQPSRPQPAAEQPPPAVVAHPVADPRPQIELVIAAYGRALESRDLGEVRRAYPGLTPAQQDGWKQFFQSVRRLKASLTVTALSVVGGTAEAVVSGVYEYENATTGRVERRPETFRAILAAEPAGWRLTTVR